MRILISRLLTIGFAAFLAWCGSAAAQIVAPAGRTLFNQGVLVRSILRYDTFAEISDDGTEVERLRNVWAVVWGAYPHLSLSFVAPLVRLETSGAGGNRTRTGTADAMLFARYDVLRKTVPAGYTRLAPEVGVKLASGGAFSTGSTDIMAGLVFSHVRDPDWLVADVQWTGFGTGDGGLERGDGWRADIAYLRRVAPRRGPGVPMVLLVAELSYEAIGRSSRPEAGVLPDSGGSLLYFSPGVEWIVGRRWVLELSVPIAVDADLNGRQSRPETSLVLGARWLF